MIIILIVICRNPYFIGILSAIPPTMLHQDMLQSGRNPYFIGILSAIKEEEKEVINKFKSQSLFYWNPFCNIF